MSEILPLDVVWISICTYLVMFMQTGFAFLESGTVRFKNLQNILIKNILDVLFGTVAWWLLGFSFAFSGDTNGFIGGEKHFAGTNFEDKDFYNFMFQWAFASTAATIVSGGVAERIRLSAYTAYLSFMTAWIYPIIVHWVWADNGWLKTYGFIDFAGSGAVHLTGGTAAFVGAILLGPRNGRFDPKREHEFIPNNLGFVVLGTFILWMGWYGFNCGSTIVVDVGKIGLIGMNTTLAGISGGLTTYCLHYMLNRNTNNKYSIPAVCNGILAGFVAVTAGCANYETYCSFFVGIIGGLIYFLHSKINLKLKIDDPLEASSLHGCVGLFGVISVAFFDKDQGIYYLHDAKLLGVQLVGVLAIFVWSFTWSFLFMGIFKIFRILRVDAQEELIGSDLTKHGQYGIIMDLDKLRGNDSDSPNKLMGHVGKNYNQGGETNVMISMPELPLNEKKAYEMVPGISKEKIGN